MIIVITIIKKIYIYKGFPLVGSDKDKGYVSGDTLDRQLNPSHLLHAMTHDR